MSDDSVLAWLSGISPQYDPRDTPARSPPRKRRRCDTAHCPLTPRSNTMSSSREPSPSKRANAQDLTPRPRHKRQQIARHGSHYSLSTTTESSAKSGQTSPQKHLKALEAEIDGIHVRDLGELIDLPPSLDSFLKQMRLVTRSRGILASDARPNFENSKNRGLAELGEDDAMFSPDRSALGPTPDTKSVLDLFKIAKECHQNFHSESSWNILVHSRLLDLALHSPEGDPFSEFIDHLPW
ncbi:hypothetical protein NM208_g984 [Fusarium decemcellulare]|uniref:Uncharacterized protein n=1 Tax=Fusarium decemcellulare TaxID=57161 RepID=A0ACC1SXN7_9HYPO|nr:hypothetical protein NM208_g984 [Fusarium decemcellulare]